MRRLVVTMLVAVAAMAPLAGEQRTPPKKRAAPVKTFQTAELTIEYPDRDWIQLPGAGSVIATFAQKNGEAAVVIDRTKLGTALAPDEITDVFTDLESDLVKERDPSVADLKAALMPLGAFPKVVRMDFTRGAPPRVERVRQVSIPSGWYLYRVVASAPTAQFPKYDEIFQRMVASLTIRPQG